MKQQMQTDIAVIGGSASGVTAAIQAARMGCRVHILEEGPWVGGMLSAAGVSAIDGNHELPSGLWGEFRSRLREHYGGPGALETGWVSNTQFNPRTAENILRSMLETEPGIQLHTSCGIDSMERVSEQGRIRIRSIQFTDSDGQSCLLRPKIVVLADEFGDSVEMAGLEWHGGLEGRTAYGESIGPEHPLKHPQDLTWTATLEAKGELVFSQTQPSSVLTGEFAGLLGNPEISWERFLHYGKLPGKYYMLNWPIAGNDLYGDYFAPGARPDIFRRAREKTLRLIRLINSQLISGEIVPAEHIYPLTKENDYTPGLALIPYIRESKRIYGLQTLALNDILKPDTSPLTTFAIASGDYPLDHHRSQDPDNPDIQFPQIPPFSLPYGSLVPRDGVNILAAEKSVSVSGLVNGCTRLQPVVMQAGQAAGAAAALCVRQNTTPAQINVRELQDKLLDGGVYLMPSHNLALDDNRFKKIQKVLLTGGGILRRECVDWANRGYVVNPDSLYEKEIPWNSLFL